MSGGDSLLDLLEARTGIVCAVGAGGKKSLLRWLATSNPGRVAITATVFTTYFQEQLGFEAAIEPEARLPATVAAIDRALSVAYGCPGDKPGRRAGVGCATVERIHLECGFAATYVKADGARMRLMKAPADDEPVIPGGSSTVLPVVSARAIGQPLNAAVAHRVERIGRITGLRENQLIAPEHVGRLLASPDGLAKSTMGLRIVPVINMVDDARREARAREAAEVALALSERIERVVLVRLARAEAPLVAVVRR